MTLTEEQRTFLAENTGAAMITHGRDGQPKVARVAITMIDGTLWSSGTRSRVRTGRLRRDPRCTLFVFSGQWQWLALDTAVTVVDGPESPDRHLRMVRAMQDKPTGPLNWFGEELDDDAFRRRMTEEGRVIYEFAIEKAYGLI
jgi:PPOX class probable F420-dependent enzyme